MRIARFQEEEIIYSDQNISLEIRGPRFSFLLCHRHFMLSQVSHSAFLCFLPPTCQIILSSLLLWDIIKHVKCPDFIVLVAINVSETVNFKLVRVHFVRYSNSYFVIILHNRAEPAHDFAEIQTQVLWSFVLFCTFVLSQ